MKKIIRKGDTGEDVKLIQEKLGLKVDGKFGPKTEEAVKEFQGRFGLKIDGVVGELTQKSLFGHEIEDHIDTEIDADLFDVVLLDRDEYVHGPNKPEYIYIHHTAGWNNPYKTIKSWNNDSRGRIATEFVIGGQSVKGDDTKWDGDIIKCLPDGAYGWHLGKNGSQHMHVNSVGIEVNNFGYLTKGGYWKRVNGKKTWIKGDANSHYTYVGTRVHPEQVCDLGYEWRGYQFWHNYSDRQIESLRNLIIFISERDGIDISKGLVEWLKKEEPGKAFDFKKKAWSGEVKGILSHSNIRKDKFDMYPHPNLVEMLKSLKQK